MSTNYYDAENNKLIPIAGKGDFPCDYGTKKEFESKKDSLPDGTVFTTTDEFVEGGEKEIYSTDEVKTNKVWHDGKPIYRKVAFIPNFKTGNYSTTSLGINNVDTMVNVDGFLTNSTYSNVPIGTFFESGYSVTAVYKANGDFQTELRGFASGNFTLIAEYTKTN